MQATWAGGISATGPFLHRVRVPLPSLQEPREMTPLATDHERFLTMRMTRLLGLVVLAIVVLLIAVEFGPAVLSGK